MGYSTSRPWRHKCYSDSASTLARRCGPPQGEEGIAEYKADQQEKLRANAEVLVLRTRDFLMLNVTLFGVDESARLTPYLVSLAKFWKEPA